MIVCVCREIRESDYADPDDLRRRIMEDDYICGQCQLSYPEEYDDGIINIHKGG